MDIKTLTNLPPFATVKRWFRSKRLRNYASLAVFFVILTLIVYSSFQSSQVNLEVDQVAGQTIVADRNAVLIDEQKTEEQRAEAAARVDKVYKEDKTAFEQSARDLEGIYAELIAVRARREQTDQERIEALKSYINELAAKKSVGMEIGAEDMSIFLVYADDEEINSLRVAGSSILEQSMKNPITEDTIGREYADISEKVDQLANYAAGKEFVKLACKVALRPNMIYDRAATEQQINKARDEVLPVEKTVKAGEVIIRQGNRVTPEQISILEQLGLQSEQNAGLTLLGVALFVLGTFWLVIRYLRRFSSAINNNLLFMIGIIFIVTLLITKGLMMIKLDAHPAINPMMSFLAPVAAASMLIGILLEQRLAYFINAILAIYVGLLGGGGQLEPAIIAFVGGTVGILSISSLMQTSDLAKAALSIALADTITILTLSIVNGDLNLEIAGAAVAIGPLNGIISAVLMFGSLPLFETVFSVTSMLKLMELSNPNHPLLKRLLLEAPGTYHHSLMVGNLAEATAEAIGANPLLVRAGAYYHDIGKIRRPEYYVENQRSASNPHDRISPALSALIITQHTKEGLDLAHEYHLPESIVDFVAEHHGNSLTMYFYNKAVREEGADYVDKEIFRYEGPRPHSKETALVMLADSVEAAVRSLSDPSLEKIRDKVHQVIDGHLHDRQFEECNLTFRDLFTIEKNFLTVLEGVYHKRIEYPENLAQELSLRREQYGYDDFKPSE